LTLTAHVRVIFAYSSTYSAAPRPPRHGLGWAVRWRLLGFLSSSARKDFDGQLHIAFSGLSRGLDCRHEEANNCSCTTCGTIAPGYDLEVMVLPRQHETGRRARKATPRCPSLKSGVLSPSLQSFSSSTPHQTASRAPCHYFHRKNEFSYLQSS
jgi:hypothetical protein